MNITLEDFYNDLKKVMEAETVESSYYDFSYLGLKENTEIYDAIKNYDKTNPFYNSWNINNNTGIITDIRYIRYNPEYLPNEDGSRGCYRTGKYNTRFTVLFKKHKVN